jgi:hypothetical protein
MKDYALDIGLYEEIFDLFYESFWDLYTFKYCVEGLSAKKL